MPVSAGAVAVWWRKLTCAQIVERDGVGGLVIERRAEDLLEGGERRFGFAVNVDDVPQVLQRPENEERVDKEREELSDGDLLVEDEIQHQEQNGRPHQVDTRPLHETEATDVAHLLELELQDLLGGRVETRDLLFCQAETLHQLDVSQ